MDTGTHTRRKFTSTLSNRRTRTTSTSGRTLRLKKQPDRFGTTSTRSNMNTPTTRTFTTDTTTENTVVSLVAVSANGRPTGFLLNERRALNSDGERARRDSNSQPSDP